MWLRPPFWKKSFEGAVSRKCCYFTAYYSLLAWYMILHVICTYSMMTSLVFLYTMSIFSWMGRGVQQMLKAKKPEGGENMAADTWDCAGRVRQEQIIRTRCNIWISVDGDLMVSTLNCWSSKKHFMF